MKLLQLDCLHSPALREINENSLKEKCVPKKHFWKEKSQILNSVFLWFKIRLTEFTSKISSLETSMRQWPAWGCCWESSCRKIFSFWTRSRLYLGTVRHSVSSGHNGTTCCCCWSFNWFCRLEKKRNVTIKLFWSRHCNYTFKIASYCKTSLTMPPPKHY